MGAITGTLSRYERIEDCAPGGGYVLGTECETPWNAKPENVKAIVDAASKYGWY